MQIKNLQTGDIFEVESLDNLGPVHFDQQGNLQDHYLILSNQEISDNNFISEKQKYIDSRKKYLISTNDYPLRELDDPGFYPQAIRDKRVLAYQQIDEIESFTNSSQLINYDIDFV